jgi:hypothetical protein
VFPSRQIFGRCCRAAFTLLLGSFLEREDIVPHSVLKDMVVRNRGARLLLAMQHTLLSLASNMPGSDQSRTFLHEFLTMSRLKISTVRLDGASEFGKSSSFIAYCTQHDIVLAPLASCTHIQNARAEGAIKICKEHVRCLLRSANLPRRFWPDALRHFCHLYAYWPDANGLSAWEKLDHLC